jgi:hypothetical protein
MSALHSPASRLSVMPFLGAKPRLIVGADSDLRETGALGAACSGLHQSFGFPNRHQNPQTQSQRHHGRAAVADER